LLVEQKWVDRAEVDVDDLLAWSTRVWDQRAMCLGATLVAEKYLRSFVADEQR
jgi:hypothetical protein